MKLFRALIVFSFAFAIHAAEAPEFDVSAKTRADGQINLYVRVELLDGPFASTIVVPRLPHTRTISTTHDGTTHQVIVELVAKGQSKATLSVMQGRTAVATKVKLFTVQPPSETRGTDPGVTPPQVLHRVELQYPAEAKAHRVAGVVVIEATIDERGTVTGTRILKNLPYGVGEAAAAAVRQWKFAPASRDGKPVAVTHNVTFAVQAEGR